MTFGFSLYAVTLLATLVIFFRTELENFNSWKTTRECNIANTGNTTGLYIRYAT